MFIEKEDQEISRLPCYNGTFLVEEMTFMEKGILFGLVTGNQPFFSLSKLRTDGSVFLLSYSQEEEMKMFQVICVISFYTICHFYNLTIYLQNILYS